MIFRALIPQLLNLSHKFQVLAIFLMFLFDNPLIIASEEVYCTNNSSSAQYYCKSVTLPDPENISKIPIAMANLEGEPSTFINGHVNVITGDFNDFQIDLTLPGIDPLTVERSFSRSTEREGSLAAGWNLNLHGILKGEPYKIDRSHYFKVNVIEGHGAGFSYQKKISKNDKRPDFMSLEYKVYKKGVTNTSSGYICGQNNIKNNRAFKKSREVYETFNGARSVREYRLHASSSDVFTIFKETKPSGNVFQYHYLDRNKHMNFQSSDELDVLHQVEVINKNNQQLALITYKLITRSKFKKFPHQDIIALDGRSVRYHFTMNSKHDRRCESILTKVDRSDAPPECYEYVEGEKDADLLISKKTRPEGRYLGVKYYKKGKNYIDKERIEISKSDDLRRNRVKSLQGPVGYNEKPVNTYRFYYSFDPISKKEKYSSIRSGSTTVLDALNNKTIYTYTKDQRIKYIDRFSQDQKMYSRESLYWGNYKSDQCTLLLSRTLASASGELSFARTYSYDDRGNVLQNTLYGNLSGHSEINPIVSEDGSIIENGCENFTKQFRYSDDGFNLILWESDGLHETSYEYESESNRLTAKFIGEANKIHLREFYEYNCEASLTKKIIDDGLSKDKNDLSGVTERL